MNAAEHTLHSSESKKKSLKIRVQLLNSKRDMSSTVAGKEVFRQPTYAGKEAEEILVVLHYGKARGRALVSVG